MVDIDQPCVEQFKGGLITEILIVDHHFGVLTVQNAHDCRQLACFAQLIQLIDKIQLDVFVQGIGVSITVD